jgi:hypothetical protein
MGEQWHYSRGGKRAGPVSPAELKHLASNGQLLPSDMVWKEGMPDWLPAEMLKGLFAAPSAAPVEPPLQTAPVLTSPPVHPSTSGFAGGPSHFVRLGALVGTGCFAAGLVLGLLLGWVLFGSRPGPADEGIATVKTEKKKIAQTQVSTTLKTAVLSYITDHGQPPQSLETLLQKDDKGGPYLIGTDALTDPWGNRYQYNASAAHPETGVNEPEIYTTDPTSGQKISNFSHR